MHTSSRFAQKVFCDFSGRLCSASLSEKEKKKSNANVIEDNELLISAGEHNRKHFI